MSGRASARSISAGGWIRQQQLRRAAAVERQRAADRPPAHLHAVDVVDAIEADRGAVAIDRDEHGGVQLGGDLGQHRRGGRAQIEMLDHARRQRADRAAETVALRGGVLHHEAAADQREQQPARRRLVEPRRVGDLAERHEAAARERVEDRQRARDRADALAGAPPCAPFPLPSPRLVICSAAISSDEMHFVP